MISLSELRAFIAAAEEESFSRAAERLHLSQPAVSQKIKSLEEHFGVDLFLRYGRAVRLCEAGEALLPLARQVMAAMLHLEDRMSGIHGDVVGDLVVGCSTSSGKYLLPILGAQFCQEYPLVRFRVQIHSREGVIDKLINERLGIGVVSKKIDLPELEYQPFFDDRVVMIVPRDHPWADYGRALPSDLLDQKVILREESAGTMEILREGLAQHDIEWGSLDRIMELGNSEAIVMAVEQGIGVGFVSSLSASRSLALGRVKQIRLEGLDLRRTIYMSKSAGCPLTRAQTRFWEFVMDRSEELMKLVQIDPAQLAAWVEKELQLEIGAAG
jgi:DNA-binding transcriptional LysR family regulator